MGSMSIWHWMIVALVIMLLFGKGRISDMMGDLAKGIKSFKQGMADDPATTPVYAPPQPPLQVSQAPLQPMAPPVAQPAPVLSPDPSPTVAPPPHPDATRP